MGVERAGRPEPPDAPATSPKDSVADPPADRKRPAVLADAGQRIAECQRYQAVVEDSGEGTRAWSLAAQEFRAAWEKIKVTYGYTERDRSAAQPPDSSWRGDGGRRLDAAQNAEIDRGYARVREASERIIVPGLRAVEAEDPARRLAGFEHRFKEPDRLKEKVADRMRTKGRPPAETLAQISDVVRFTFEYSDAAYSEGVVKDVERLEAKGFTQLERRNTWESDQYKGINARWHEPESGVTFEVQFHTRASLEAKELTHKAYERIRSITDKTPEADRETSELKEFQRWVNSMIPIPPGVADVDDYPPGGK